MARLMCEPADEKQDAKIRGYVCRVIVRATRSKLRTALRFLVPAPYGSNISSLLKNLARQLIFCVIGNLYKLTL
jgi:hypothetical protein